MMNVVPSTIEFRGYRVSKAQFGLTKIQLAEGETVQLNPSFTRTIKQTGENTFSLELGVKLGSDNDSSALPFFTEIIIEGYFVLDKPEDADTAMKVNGVAILFPYLRTTLTMLTSIANINPVVLPTINLVKMFEQECSDQQTE